MISCILKNKRLNFLVLAAYWIFGYSMSQAQELIENQTTPVALQIYLYEDVAINKSHEDLFERLFAQLRPDIQYRRISINSNRWGIKKEDIVRELREKMQSILQPNETLEFLLIDTHGNTQKSKTQDKVTSLKYIGEISEIEVNTEFEKTFNSVKEQAASDLKVILNSCSTFCGGERNAQLRGQVLLDYFGATEGSIYGSDTSEIAEVFNYPELMKWKYLAPRFKTFLSITMTATILASPVVAMSLLGPFKSDLSAGKTLLEVLPKTFANLTLLSSLYGKASGALGALLKPLYQFLASKKHPNKGYYFAFESGKISTSEKVIKHELMPQLISNHSPILSCQKLLSL